MNQSDQLASDYNEEAIKKNWQNTLIELVLLEERDCPTERRCYINNILHFVEKEIIRQRSEERDKWEKEGLMSVSKRMGKEFYEDWRKIERKRIKDLITQEIVIAQQEGTPTSRLTSLFNNLT